MAKNRHWGITVLAVLGYIGAVLGVLGGIAMLVGSAFVSTLMLSVPVAAALGALSAGMVVFGGLVMIASGIFGFFVARGLMRGKNWARIVTLVFAALGVLGSIVPLNIFSLVVNGVIVWYLGFFKLAVAYFK